MASAEAAVIAAVGAVAEVAAAGAGVFIAGGRVGSVYPYVTLQRVSTPGAGRLDGAATLVWPRFQIDFWARTAAEALALAEAARRAMDGVEITAAGLTFTATFQDQRGPAPDEETGAFRVGQDYSIWHERN